MSDELLYMNGIDAANGRYLHEPMSIARVAEKVRDDQLDVVPRGTFPFLNASDLAEVGWGVMFGPSVPDAVRKALTPLLERRERQAGELYRDDLKYRGGNYLQFLEDNGVDLAPVIPGQMPYYLLLVGGPEEIPFEFQYQLDVQYAVGRLSFERAEEYANYVKGVLAVEEEEVRRTRRVDLFGVRNWDDPVTPLCIDHLVRPLDQALGGVSGWRTRAFLREEANKRRLTQILGGRQTSSLLLTMSHALLFWPDEKRQRSHQGALLCFDWPGPKEWSGRVPAEHYFAADDVSDDADLRGLISFHVACHSAGTPKLDSFSRAIGKKIPENAGEDFVAALPRRLLGHPNGGALAFIGHVDLAWPHSFSWRKKTSHIAHFQSAFRELMAGKPVGLALESFGLRYSTIATLLTEEMDDRRRKGDTGGEDEDEVYLWTAHHDARGYVLFGDPAVRLPGRFRRRKSRS